MVTSLFSHLPVVELRRDYYTKARNGQANFKVKANDWSLMVRFQNEFIFSSFNFQFSQIRRFESKFQNCDI